MTWSWMSLGTVLMVGLTNPPVTPDIVVSTHVVIAGGQSSGGATLAQMCPKGSTFYVHAITAMPELQVGNTGRDVTSLGKWAVTVGLLQPIPGSGALGVPFTAFAEGPQIAQAQLPGGQRLAMPAVGVSLVGTPAAAARYEFNVHVSGRCGPA